MVFLTMSGALINSLNRMVVFRGLRRSLSVRSSWSPETYGQPLQGWTVC